VRRRLSVAIRKLDRLLIVHSSSGASPALGAAEEAGIQPRSSFPRRRESSVFRNDTAESLDPRLRGDDGAVVCSRIENPMPEQALFYKASRSSGASSALQGF